MSLVQPALQLKPFFFRPEFRDHLPFMTGILIKSRTSGIKVFLLAKVALRILQYFRSEFRSEEQPALPIDPFQKYEEKKEITFITVDILCKT